MWTFTVNTKLLWTLFVFCCFVHFSSSQTRGRTRYGRRSRENVRNDWVNSTSEELQGNLERPGNISMGEIGMGEIRSMNTTDPTLTSNPIPNPPRKRRRRLRPKSGNDGTAIRLQNSMLRRTLSLDMDTQNISDANPPEDIRRHIDQLPQSHQSFINYEDAKTSSEPVPSPIYKPREPPTIKPSKKYYPIFRKPGTLTLSTSPLSLDEEEKIEYFKKKYILPKSSEEKEGSSSKRNSSRQRSKLNPPLFSLRSVNDLRTDESANPFQEGAAAPISTGIGGDNSKHLNFFHPLLNSDSVHFSESIPQVAENATSIILPDPTIMPTMADDLLPSDEMPMTTERRKKSQPYLTIGTNSQDFVRVLTKKCDPPKSSADNSTVKTNTTFSGSLHASASMDISETDKTFATTTDATPETTTESSIPPTSNSHEDTFVVSFSDPHVISSSTDSSSSDDQTIPSTLTLSFGDHSPSEPATTPASPKSYPPTEDSTSKIQREISTITPEVYSQSPTPFRFNPTQPAPTAPPATLNPFDFGSILNLFQLPQATSPPYAPPKPISGSFGGILDSLNSLSNLLSPSTSSSSSFFTTPRPIRTTAADSPLQKALSNMINVITNPFGVPQDKGLGAPVSNSLDFVPPKPAVPISPTDYLSQLLKLGSDLGLTPQTGSQTFGKDAARHASPVAQPSAPPVHRQIFTTTTPKPLFDFSNLLSGNWLGTTTPAPSLNLLSLLTGFINPFGLTTRTPSIFSAAASDQQPGVYVHPDQKNGPYFWLDMNTFIPGHDEKINPTTGIRPKLGQRDYFFKVRR